jgi:hypothetical protein
VRPVDVGLDDFDVGRDLGQRRPGQPGMVAAGMVAAGHDGDVPVAQPLDVRRAQLRAGLAGDGRGDHARLEQRIGAGLAVDQVDTFAGMHRVEHVGEPVQQVGAGAGPVVPAPLAAGPHLVAGAGRLLIAVDTQDLGTALVAVGVDADEPAAAGRAVVVEILAAHAEPVDDLLPAAAVLEAMAAHAAALVLHLERPLAAGMPDRADVAAGGEPGGRVRVVLLPGAPERGLPGGHGRRGGHDARLDRSALVQLRTSASPHQPGQGASSRRCLKSHRSVMLAVVLPGGGACSAGGVGVVSGPAVRLRGSVIAPALLAGTAGRQREPLEVRLSVVLGAAGRARRGRARRQGRPRARTALGTPGGRRPSGRAGRIPSPTGRGRRCWRANCAAQGSCAVPPRPTRTSWANAPADVAVVALGWTVRLLSPTVKRTRVTALVVLRGEVSRGFLRATGWPRR